jgi:3'(2'), 5'-bisphosphate nucleotidase
MEDTLIKELLSIGKEVMKIYRGNFKQEIKADNSPVTEADLYVEGRLIKFLEERFDYEVLGEESKREVSGDKIWVLDPIDGTKDFIQKTGDFSIMLGLLDAKAHQPLLGLVYSPALNIVYYAKRGEGAYKLIIENFNVKEKTKLKINSKKLSILLRSRVHFSNDDERLMSYLGINKSEKRGSAGLKISLIADNKGHFTYYLSPNVKIWDVCAPHIILEEAGGYIGDKQGNPLYYDLKNFNLKQGIIATNTRENYLKIIKAIKETFNDDKSLNFVS